MGDESWIYIYDPETKQQSLQWKSPQLPKAKKAWQIRSSTKSMLITFLDVPAHMSLKATQFVTNNNMVIDPHLPYSLDFAPCDFALFPCPL
jgi:hypothetical protein